MEVDKSMECFSRVMLFLFLSCTLCLLCSSLGAGSTEGQRAHRPRCGCARMHARRMRGTGCGAHLDMGNIDFFDDESEETRQPDQEDFSDGYHSYTKSRSTSSVQSVSLTAPTEEDGAPAHMMIGTAKKETYQLVSASNGNAAARSQAKLTVSANVYLLDANVYPEGANASASSYVAFLSATPKLASRLDDKDAILLGTMKRDNDGMYKVQKVTDDVGSLDEYKYVYVAMEKRGVGRQIILQGRFSN